MVVDYINIRSLVNRKSFKKEGILWIRKKLQRSQKVKRVSSICGGIGIELIRRSSQNTAVVCSGFTDYGTYE
jgi:hypothetical protein